MNSIVYWTGSESYDKFVPSGRDYNRFYRFTPSQPYPFNETDKFEAAVEFIKIRTDNINHKLNAHSIYWTENMETDRPADFTQFDYDDTYYSDLDELTDFVQQHLLTNQMCAFFDRSTEEEDENKFLLKTNERRLLVPNALCEIYGFETNDAEQIRLFEANGEYVAKVQPTIPTLDFYVDCSFAQPNTYIGEESAACIMLLSRREGRVHTALRVVERKFFPLLSSMGRIGEHRFSLRYLDHTPINCSSALDYFLCQLTFRRKFSLDF